MVFASSAVVFCISQSDRSSMIFMRLCIPLGSNIVHGQLGLGLGGLALANRNAAR